MPYFKSYITEKICYPCSTGASTTLNMSIHVLETNTPLDSTQMHVGCFFDSVSNLYYLFSQFLFKTFIGNYLGLNPTVTTVLCSAYRFQVSS